MILREEKPRPNYYDKKEVVRYALFPTKLKRAIDDKTGEIIWLEKYVKIYKHTSVTKQTWLFDRSLRLSVHVLNKFEDKDSEDKAENCELGQYTKGTIRPGLVGTLRI